MHFEVVTDKQSYVCKDINRALKMQHLLQTAGISCIIKCVHKARVF